MGLKFIPLFSPAPDRYKSREQSRIDVSDLSSNEEDSEFTPEEINRFTRLYEEQYDIYEERYEQWKLKEKSCELRLENTLPKNTLIKQTFARTTVIVAQHVPKPNTGSARVLTSI